MLVVSLQGNKPVSWAPNQHGAPLCIRVLPDCAKLCSSVLLRKKNVRPWWSLPLGRVVSCHFEAA